MFGPSRVFFPPVLWPLLTSRGSLLLRIFLCACEISPGTHTFFPSFTCRIYRKRFRVAIGLCSVMQTYPRFRPYMRFLFVRPEFCPLGDLSTPNIRLSSDSTSRWTPLSLAKPSHYRATSGLSPYRTCAHRAHMKCGATKQWHRMIQFNYLVFYRELLHFTVNQGWLIILRFYHFQTVALQNQLLVLNKRLLGLSND